MKAESITREWVNHHLPLPHKNDHKGTRGTLNILAGSHRYRGAAILCAGAALRAGAGLVRLVSTSAVCNAAAAALPPCILQPVRKGVAGGIGMEGADMALAGKPTALLMGCGMGMAAETTLLVRHMLQGTPCPLVLDADALNALAGHTAHGDDSMRRKAMLALLQKRQAATILTPHVGEMARLAGLSTGEVAERQDETALHFAQQYGCVVVLKSHDTTIAAPNGKVYRNDSAGNPGLATGGSGDVLAGILGSLLAQGMEAQSAAACAVWLHAATADIVAEGKGCAGLSPEDLHTALPTLLHALGR